ncbi:2-amino-3,7-dideoxy-D-threo-hept-6-ulosonate synthase [Paractinoplanes ferrugineus]|uniref:2-amino-3,7-dideoxy-D-threo-hept-6-ulosonate synthase n=1 Tax=Paractinoplanes ferrugineus TaxID=113564 RepID=A0A919J492_9ACTN|nr:2-amino-3,7-dideoxy-D-threo-hept-6-ulosonate synthase [Actinoplanes ferrugineus]GIE13087.1 2-amino-3,7-dideoxy-D-threo-hept-6-ulosonate synthase [Actinoplanes ferrugineus]
MTDVYCLSGKGLRQQRILHQPSGTTFLVPLDHSLADGPLSSAAGFASLIASLAVNDVDGIIVHKGRVRFLPTEALGRMALIVHLNGSTRHAPDTDAKTLVSSVAEAVALGADGVSVHINLGSDTEAAQLSDLGLVAEQCARWGVPLLAMVYPRGPRITDSADPTLLAHAANVAADLGADIVKLPFTGSPETMRGVVAASPIPVVTAGGGVLGNADAFVRHIGSAMESGVLGVAAGRNIFRAADPGRMARSVARRVHAGLGSPQSLTSLDLTLSAATAS